MAPRVVDTVSTRVVETGSSAPLGASVHSGGVGFSVFSKDATRIELLLFDDEAATAPAQVIPLDANAHRTYHYWHAFVPGLVPGQVYGYRAYGPFAPERGPARRHASSDRSDAHSRRAG